MSDDILENLRISYREVMAKNARTKNIVALKRYLNAIADILDIWLNFQRDRKYGW